MAYLTFFDVVEHLITASFGGPQDAEQRDIRTAVHRAYAEVTQIRDWAYYQTHCRVITQVPYKTGTVTTVGQAVTLSGGVWPDWSASGAYLKVGNQIAQVLSRNSDTSLTVDPVIEFKGDITTPSSFILYRTIYPLPADFRNMDEPSDEYNWWSGLYVSPDEAMKLERISNSSGKPYHWTILKDPYSSGWALKLIGYPTITETVDFVYRRSARPIRLSGHEATSRAGTIAIADSEVAGTGTSFSSDMVGSILRIGTATDSPGPLASISPYTAETKITAQSSSTSITVDGSQTVSGGTKYLITDPIDVPPHMHNVIYSGAEYWLARLRGTKPDNAYAMYQRDLRLAFEMDTLNPTSGRSNQIWHNGGWRSPLKLDEGV